MPAPPVDSGVATAEFRARREGLLADRRRAGRAFTDALRGLTDRWLADLFVLATEATPRGSDGAALVAVGGYGRGDLCPGSDIDVVLLHNGRKDIAVLAEQLWYPVWDAGVTLGHSVRSLKEALGFAANDLDTATAFLSCRHIAGDEALTSAFAEGAAAQWRKRARHNVKAVAEGVRKRQARAGEVAFLLEPDLKEGRGGLRDVHALSWVERARSVHDEGDRDRLATAYDVLLAVRVELHRQTGRRGDMLALQYQDAVAEALGDGDADALMERLSAAARTIAWISDEAWELVESSLAGPGAGGVERELEPGIRLVDGVVSLGVGAEPDNDPSLALRAASAAARHHTRLDRSSLLRLGGANPPMPAVWTPEMRDAWIGLLLAGRDGLRVIEALDQVRVWEQLVPEWSTIRNRPQRNAYHRFTVDRHLLETVANAGSWADRVSRPDLLVTGALLHDLGKGHPGDHTEVGVALARTVATRLGFPPPDVAVLQAMVQHHLLLPDVATRRDLSDPATAARVAEAAGSTLVLELLWALCEADSLATGSSAWGPWKAELVAELVDRTRAVLVGGPAPEVASAFPTPTQAELLAAGERVVYADADTLVVVAPDRPGLLGRVAGVLSLHGLDVLAADAVSGSNGAALEQFKVAPAQVGSRARGGEWVERWPKVCRDIERAIDGRLAIHARVADRARIYQPRVAMPETYAPNVTIDNGASAAATVIEVSAPNSIGLLYRVTRALADLDLDVHTAKVQTLGAVVVDAFYVVDASGAKLIDEPHLREVERAILHAVDPAG